MILRRVMEHVKAQDWFAVALDFVIVVAGVFVGLQVSNWNAARVEAAQEHDTLLAIAEDLRVERVELQRGAKSVLGSIGAADYALRAVGEDGVEALLQRLTAVGGAVTAIKSISPDAEQKKRLWAISVTSFYPTGSVAAFDALTNTGRLDIIKDQGLRRALQNYRQRWRGLDETQAGTMRPLRNSAISTGERYGLSLITTLPEEAMFQKLKENEELRAVLQNQVTFKTLHYDLIVDLDRDAATLLEKIERKIAQQ